MDEALPPAPYHELLGITLLEWRDGYAKLGLAAGRQHMNRSGIVHGGVMLSLIDQAGAYAGLYCTVPGNIRRAVTVDLDCRFTGQAGEGQLIAEGRIVTAGNSVFFTRTEVFGPDGKMVAFGAGTHRWRRGSNTPEGVPVDAPVERG
ncbi:PaaI family thioesterase [Muricoccus radiodurans]|uniref:PaaI family thioesterase n=1 Tax=Muricoccus radiodurans TaxID=2231721 RepID=UPI003CF62936